jgi:hypothetical protein
MSILSVNSAIGTAIPTFLADSRNEQALATKWAQGNGQMQSDIAYFQSKASTLTSVDALMKDYRSLKIVLGAYNVSGLLAYPALTRQLLSQDPSSASSSAQKIGNPSYIAFAKAFDQFQNNPLASSTNVATVVTSYVTNSFEAAQNTATPGMQNALTFNRTASQITSITQLMTNTPALTVAVAQTGINFTTYANMSYDQQVAFLTKKITLSNFQNPAKVTKMAEQYLIQAVQDPTAWGASNANTNTVVSLLGGSSDTSELSLFGVSSSTNPVLSLFA